MLEKPIGEALLAVSVVARSIFRSVIILPYRNSHGFPMWVEA